MFRFLVVIVAVFAFSVQAQAQFTTKSSSAAKPSVRQTAPITSQKMMFRPQVRKNPQAVAETDSADEDDIPSFAPMTGKADPVLPARSVPVRVHEEPTKGEIWFYVTNYELDDVLPNSLMCSWDFVVQNRTNKGIKTMFLAGNLKSVFFQVRIPPLASGASKVMKLKFISQECPLLRTIKPAMSKMQCQLDTASKEQCQQIIVLK